MSFKRKSKTLSLLLTLAMLLTLWPGVALADPDITPPAFDADSPRVGTLLDEGSRAVSIIFETKDNEQVYYYLVLLPDDADEPDSEQVKSGQDASDSPALYFKTNEGDSKTSNISMKIRAPQHDTDYDIYIVLGDDEGNLSVPAKIEVTTPAAADFFVAGYPKTGAVQAPASKKMEVLVTIQVPNNGYGRVHYVLVEQGADAPSIDQVIAGKDSAGNNALDKNTINCPNDTEKNFFVIGDADATDYDLYLVAQDTYPSDAPCTEAVKLGVTTPPATATPPTTPTITGAVMDAQNRYITVTFSEGVYGNAAHNTGIDKDDFAIAFVQNAGGVSGASINSVYKVGTGLLPTGGETQFDIGLKLVDGPPSGTETIAISPIADSIYSSSGVAVPETESTGVISLNSLSPQSFAEGYPETGAPQAAGSKSVQILVKVALAGVLNYVVLPDGATAPTAQQIKDHANIDGQPVISYAGQSIGANVELPITLDTNLDHDTAYDIYMVAEAGNNNFSAVKVLDVRTPPETGTDTPINIAAIPGVTAPVTGATPVTEITETAQYTGTVSWSPAHKPFDAGRQYTATITLTPKSGYTLTGVAANFFTVAGAESTTYVADSDVVTAVFPATAAVPLDNYVCRRSSVPEQQYTFLQNALYDVEDGQTITLLGNINHSGGIEIEGKSVQFNLSGRTLNVTNASGPGFVVTNGAVTLMGDSGSFNVTGSRFGVQAYNSSVTVTSATATSDESGSAGVWGNTGSSITVRGNVTATGLLGKGASAINGGTIVIKGNAAGSAGAAHASGTGSSIVVEGDATATGSGGAGVWADSGATVTVKNVTSGMSSEGGAKAQAGSTITINGTITAPAGYYIKVENTDKTVDEKDTSSDKSGYLQYSATATHTSFVWVKDATAPAGTTGNPVWAKKAALPASSPIEDMKYLNGAYWAVGYNSTLLKSTDGETWTKVNVGTQFDRLTGITYDGSGTYVLVSTSGDYSGRIYTSTNGTDWTEKAAVPQQLSDVAFGGGKFVAVGGASNVLISTDNGATWQSRTLTQEAGKKTKLLSIAYSAISSKFVAVGMGSDTIQHKGGILTSADGETWTGTYSDSTNTIWDVTYGDGGFVAVGGRESGGYFLAISSFGDSWTKPVPSPSYAQLFSVEYDGARFVAAGRTNPGMAAFTTTSLNGVNWTDKIGGGLPYLDAAASNGTRIVAMSGYGNIYSSDDLGTSWTYRTLGTTKTLNDVAYNGTNLYVAVGAEGTIQTSGDGINWAIQNSGTTYNLNKVDYLGGKFIAVGKNGTILTSSDGTTWTVRTSGTTLELKGIAYSGGKYVVVGGDDDWAKVICVSDDAETWSNVDAPGISVSLNTVAFGDGVFITLTKNGAAFTSSDGATWSGAESLDSSSKYPTDLIYAGGKFAAVGGSGEIYLSSDKGGKWSIVKSDFGQYNRGIAYGGGNFIAVGDLGNIIASADGGATWYRQPAGLELNPHSSDNNMYTDLKGIMAGNNCFVAVGAAGLVLKSNMTAVSDDADAHDVAVAKSALDFNNIKHNADNSAGSITRSMHLMTALSAPTDVPNGSGALDVEISWQSSRPTVISGNGTVNRPAFEQGDQVVYLTATFTKNSATATKTFIVRVLANEAGGLTDAQRVAAAKAALGDGSVTVPAGSDQAAKTAAVQSYVNGLLAAVPEAVGVTAIVSYNSGTGEYDVALSKGGASDSKSLDIMIIESADPDIAIVANALNAAENAAYSNMTQAAASSEDAIKAVLRNTAVTAVNNANVSVTVNKVSYVVPLAGTSTNPSGTNGSYAFTVTVSKGAQSQTTTQKTIIISATAYTSPSPSGGGGSTPSGILVTPAGKDATTAGITLSFPAGAVESDIRVQVNAASLTSGMNLPADSQLISQVVDIIKNKSGNFAEPVTITMSFDKSKTDPAQYYITICYFDEGTGQWVELDNIRVDVDKSTVSGEVHHFTKFAVIATLKKEQPPVPPALPADVADHWAKDSIAQLINAGVAGGYPDGSFQPDKTVTRAEFTIMLVKALKLESMEGPVFADTAAHWAQDSISTAAAHGFIGGYDQNSFGPDDLITREQAAVIIARAAQLEAGGEALKFTDSGRISPWALSGVAAAVSSAYLTGYPDNSFRPQGHTTRAEAAALIAKFL
jgi:photosystem II stability/assembly factor-like uncharacterized protein